VESIGTKNVRPIIAFGPKAMIGCLACQYACIIIPTHIDNTNSALSYKPKQ